MSDVVQKSSDEKFCESCGAVIKKAAEICVKCGVRQSAARAEYTTTTMAEKDWLVTLLLALFCPVHRFYTGHTGLGILFILTGGGCGIWWLIDVISILTGSYKDAEGRPLRKK